MSVVRIARIPEAKEYGGKAFPLCYQPAEKGVGPLGLSEWISRNRAKLQAQLRDHGAVLFRGFDLRAPTEQATAMIALGLRSMPYVGGAAVRNKVVGDLVMTTNESPSKEPIPFHHEMAQCPEPPSHLCFMCKIAARQGGATPIVRSDVIYNYLESKHPEFCSKMSKLGLRYVRVMPEENDPSSAIGRSWKATFNASTRAEAEAAMRKIGTTWEWLPNGDLRTTTATVPGIREDPRTGKKVFFNSAVAAFKGWIDKRNDPAKAVLLGDGAPVDVKAIADIASFMDSEKVSFAWKDGDVLFVDNYVSMHSRQPFSGPRVVAASIFREDYSKSALEAKAKAEESAAQSPATALGAYAGSNAKFLLNTGAAMPAVGLGMWKVPGKLCPDIVVEAVKAGYRCFDNACDYGNEEQVGAGLARAFESKIVERSDVWITSKLWNTYHAKQHVRAACLKTLKDLGLKYLDLYLIHFPIAMKFVPFEKRYPPEWSYDPDLKLPFKKSIELVDVPIAETWAAMEELVNEGLVKNIGVANFNTVLLRELLKTAKIRPAVNQVELHPMLTQDTLLRFCRREGIHVTGFSNLGGSSYVELGMAKKSDSLMDTKTVRDVAAAVGRSPAQVLLRWGIQRGNSIIPKTTKVLRLKENIGLFDFSLSADQMDAISSLNINRRFNDPAEFADIPIYQ